MQEYDVVALGEVLIDFTTDGLNSDGYPIMSAHPGGAPANFLATLAKHGAKTALLAKLGSDSFGRLLLNTLENNHIYTGGTIVDECVFTTLAFVNLDEKGERSFSFARKPGADTCIRTDELDFSIIENTKVFHFGTLSLTHEPARTTTRSAVRYAKEQGKLLSFDPNLRRPLWDDIKLAAQEMFWGFEMADVVKISDEEAGFLFPDTNYEETANILLKKFDVKLLFITMGSKGCFYANKNCFGYVPGPKNIRPVDTTGAGDIFCGTAVWKIIQSGKNPGELSNEELNKLCAYACDVASRSTEKAGGISSIPDLL